MTDTLDLSNLENYSTDELSAAVKKINKVLEKRTEGELKKVRSQMQKLAKQMGYELVTMTKREDVPEGGKRPGRPRKETETAGEGAS